MITETRTGFVRIIFVSGVARTIKATSFGEAASRMACGRGSILRFEWVTDTQIVCKANLLSWR